MLKGFQRLGELRKTIRYHLGTLALRLGLVNFFREFQLLLARAWVLTKKEALRSAWARRSIVTQDYIPFWSDVDISAVIEDRPIASSLYRQSLLNRLMVSDTQYICSSFYQEWMKTGGLRNRQCKNWLALKKNQHELPFLFDKGRDLIAFEVAHEGFLLYRQFMQKLATYSCSANPFDLYSLIKLAKDLTRLRTFWETQDESVLYRERASFSIQNDWEKFIHSLDSFWEDLAQSVHPLFMTYSEEIYVSIVSEEGSLLDFEFDGRKVFMLHTDFRGELFSLLKKGYFPARSTFVRLMKGVGVHEQTFINQLAREYHPYYYPYCLQRLANDLVNSALEAPQDHGRLFYCYFNIKEFLYAFDVVYPGWDEVQSRWETRQLAYDSDHSLPQLVELNLHLLLKLDESRRSMVSETNT